MAIKLSSPEKDVKKKQLLLLQLAKKLKKIKGFKPRTKVEELALKLARQKGHIVYGSVVTSRYSSNIKPKDIDISSTKPYQAAKELQKELLKKKIKAEIKKKYIPPLKRNIYEVDSVSYSPIQQSKVSESELYRKLRETKLSKEIKALSKSISDPSRYYRSKKDYNRLMQLKKRLVKKKEKEEFMKQLELLRRQGSNAFLNILKEKKQKWI